MTTASASGAPRITGIGSPRSERRSEVLEIPRTKRRRPTLNAFSAIEVLVPYTSNPHALPVSNHVWIAVENLPFKWIELYSRGHLAGSLERGVGLFEN
jgi:hypothetical protein